jgi:hypothetical protein
LFDHTRDGKATSARWLPFNLGRLGGLQKTIAFNFSSFYLLVKIYQERNAVF